MARQQSTGTSEATVTKPSSQPLGAGAVRLGNLLAPTLILITPLIGFLRYHHYELWRAESLLSIAVFVALGLIFSGVIALRPVTFRPAVIALLLVLFLDLQFRSAEGAWMEPLVDWGFAWRNRVAAAAGGAVVVLLAFMTLTWLLRRHLGVIVSSIFGVMVLSTALLPSEGAPIGETYSKASVARTDLPPVVHLALDGQIGLGGIPRDIPGGDELHRELRRFYEQFGFVVFDRAFSHYISTFESLSNLVNGRANLQTGSNIAVSDGRVPQKGIRLRQNAWFRALSEQGYRIRVYQTDYLDFCRPDMASIDYCFVAPSNSIRSVMFADLAWTIKARIILNTYLSGSLAYGIAVKAARLHLSPDGFLGGLGQWVWNREWLGAISAAAVLDRIARDLRSAPRGTAYFAHLMIPHGAYVFDADCGLRPDIDTWLGPVNTNPPSVNTPASRKARYQLYFDQVRCAHRKLAAIFKGMEDAGVFAGATVIVHGDHGSRIPIVKVTHRSLDQVSDTDMIDSHSTLFAVRSPGIPAGRDQSMRSIQSLFAETVLERPLAEDGREVFIGPAQARKAGSAFIRQPMPEFGD